jgi:hypothetical protein
MSQDYDELDEQLVKALKVAHQKLTKKRMLWIQYRDHAKAAQGEADRKIQAIDVRLSALQQHAGSEEVDIPTALPDEPE